jgi:hypothetical protein
MAKAHIFSVLALAAAIGCGSSTTTGQAKTFNVTLAVANETPPCTQAGANATGTATVTVSADNTTVTVNATYSGLSGPATAAHIHYGTPAASGPVVLPFAQPLTSPVSETLTAANYVAASGAPADFPTFVTALRAGGAAYINFHTAACPPGEIRAELQ